MRGDHVAVQVDAVGQDGGVLAVLDRAGGPPGMCVHGGTRGQPGRHDHEAESGLHAALPELKHLAADLGVALPPIIREQP